MLRLPTFEYLAPQSLPEAVGLLAKHGAQAMLVAGGTDVYPNMKRRQVEPAVLIGLRGLAELKLAHGDADNGLTLGAGMTLTQVGRLAAVQQAYPALAQAAGLVSTPQLRNMGTLGGNLCLDTRCNYYDQSYHWRQSIGFCLKKDGDTCLVAPGSARCWAVSSTDTAPALIALGASVRLVGPAGERVIPVRALYRDDGLQYLTKARDEILAEVQLPPAAGWRSVYLKLRRRGSFDFPILGVAAAARFEADGRCLEARLALGGVHSHPLEAAGAAAMLVGHRWTPELIEAAASAAAKLAKPVDNTDSTLSYRKKMAPVYVGRALAQLVK